MKSEKSNFRNLGPISTYWLSQIGIFTRSDLERMGSVEAYIQLKRMYPKKVSLNLLYALEACIMDIYWKQLPIDIKSELKQKALITRNSPHKTHEKH